MKKADKQKLMKLKTRRTYMVKHNFKLSPKYIKASGAALLRVCNGIGNESMPRWLRKDITYILRLFKGPADNHDFRFEESDGTKVSWRRANKEMKYNNKLMIRLKYPFVFGCYFRSMYWRTLAKAVDIALRTKYGFGAWQEAYMYVRARAIVKQLNKESKKGKVKNGK
jgi:hypothetical protein